MARKKDESKYKEEIDKNEIELADSDENLEEQPEPQRAKQSKTKEELIEEGKLPAKEKESSANEANKELQRAENEIWDKYSKQGNIALTLLSSMVSGKNQVKPDQYDGLVDQSFRLAEKFQSELDRRYNTDILEARVKHQQATSGKLDEAIKNSRGK